MFNLYYLILIFITSIALTSCSTTTPLQKSSPHPELAVQQHIVEFKIILSNEGEHLFDILIAKDTETFFKKIPLKQKYNKKRYELIQVYSTGVYPSYHPDQIKINKSSIFRDDTFDKPGNIFGNDKNATIILLDKFDNEKFLNVSRSALDVIYSKTKLAVNLETHKNINVEYTRLELDITRKPTMQLMAPTFHINDSAIQAELISHNNIGLTKQKRIYKIPIPTGNNLIKVKLSSKSGQNVDDTETVKNSFSAIPSLYILALGINNFDKWGEDKTLKNAINDAELVQRVFNDKGAKLFNNMSVKPHSLTPENTTRDNINLLIQQFRNKIKPNDYFLLYVASHGVLEDNEYYFAPSDFEWDAFMSNEISENNVSDYLINIPTIFRMAILDTCHAGKQVDVIKRDIKDLPLGKKEGVSILTATKTEQIANDEYQGHGLFTYLLAEGLNGLADYNNDSIIDSIEIAQYVKSHVGEVSRAKTSIAQDAVILPDPKDRFSKRFELTFLEKKEFQGFQPSVFTPKETELYIHAIQKNDAVMMNGIVRNNTRQHYDRTTPSIDGDKLSVQKIIQQLEHTESVDIDINFSVNSSNLSVTEKQKVDIIAKALQADELKNKRVLLGGHTDADGSDESNMALSQQRAGTIAKRLSKKLGVTGSRVEPIGFGELYPISDNETREGKMKNRRVSVFIYD